MKPESIEKLKEHSLLFFYYLLIYGVLLIDHGYIYGSNDMVEILPYAAYLNDPSLYSEDFYIQHIIQAFPNERIIFSSFLALLGPFLEWGCFLLHALFSIVLLKGLHEIGKIFIGDKGLVMMATMVLPLGFLYLVNLGGNELYYNMFVSSLVAKAILVWGVYYFLKHDLVKSSVLLSIGTFIHPVAGAQLFLLFVGISVIMILLKAKNRNWKNLVPFCSIYCLTAGIWILFLKLKFDGGSIDPTLLFEIISFRFPHHYIPSSFPIFSYVFFIPLYLFATYYFFKNKKEVFWFFILNFIGLIVFYFGVEWLNNPSIFSSQWFKATIWMKSFAFIAVFAWIEKSKLFYTGESIKPQSRAQKTVVLLVLFGVIMGGLYVRDNSDFPWQKIEQEADRSIAIAAQKNTSKDAVFLIPASNSTFSLYSQRSVFISYKTMVHRPEAMAEWYRRFQLVYGLNGKNFNRDQSLEATADAAYKGLSETEMRKFKSEGITHILVEKDQVYSFSIIAENEKFRIYKL